uniref:SFRICE_008285 n=1 Tax=Spodoptera frugiperda TaxID=7108 RepID=A0A2H1VAR6_SPOFR
MENLGKDDSNNKVWESHASARMRQLVQSDKSISPRPHRKPTVSDIYATSRLLYSKGYAKVHITARNAAIQCTHPIFWND